VPEEFNNPYSFPISPLFQVDGYALGVYATNHSGPLHLKHPGVIPVQTAGINEVANGIVQGAAHNGVSISSNDIIYVPFAQPNFDSYILQFRSEGVDGLITQLDPFSYVRLYSAMESNGGVYPHLAGAGIDKQSVDQAIGNPLVGVYSFMPFLETQGNPAGDPEVALYNQTLATYFPGQVPNQDAFSAGAWVSCRVFEKALASLGSNITRNGLVRALDSQIYQVANMVPPLNYGATNGTHAANHCASYITYTANHTWKIAISPPFTCY
jgi:ABC-type branched-subunit amino acid transport system substrate-binding protein